MIVHVSGAIYPDSSTIPRKSSGILQRVLTRLILESMESADTS